ncbi:MAG: cyclic nucleotide-binding domain-containing protein [Lachnospiraceae bacterium]|nr:cyclic nucleotide-binding domain-containing protein [Lachnospiraceae bacterium]
MLYKVTEGMVVVKEGEVNMDMYKLVSGKAEVYVGYGTDRETVIGILSEGSYFGELGLLAQKPAIYTIVMYSDGLLLRITMNEIEEYIKTNERDILAIMKHMANSMYNLKFNIDMLSEDLSTMVEEQRVAKNIETMRQRTRASNVAKEFLMRNNSRSQFSKF